MKCLTWWKLRGKVEEQKMSALQVECFSMVTTLHICRLRCVWPVDGSGTTNQRRCHWGQALGYTLHVHEYKSYTHQSGGAHGYVQLYKRTPEIILCSWTSKAAFLRPWHQLTYSLPRTVNGHCTKGRSCCPEVPKMIKAVNVSFTLLIHLIGEGPGNI